MEYAIAQLVDVENILKDAIGNLEGFGVDVPNLRENLLEIQTAIIVLQANAEVVSLAKAQALRTLQK